MKKNLVRMAAYTLFLSLTACARTYQANHVETADFLHDYSILKENVAEDALLSYWKDGTNWQQYNKVIVMPVVIRNVPDSELNELSHSANANLKELLEYRVRQALKKDFTLVNKPGADTLRIELAITDAESSTALLNLFSTLYDGKASIERRITDSSTGELLMASADARNGGKSLEGSSNNWDDFEQSLIYWTQQLSYQLCRKKGNRECQAAE